MFTVPVSGQVWRTACDSLRMRTQVRPAPGKAWRALLHDGRAGALQAATKAAAMSSGLSAARASHSLRSTE